MVHDKRAAAGDDDAAPPPKRLRVMPAALPGSSNPKPPPSPPWKRLRLVANVVVVFLSVLPAKGRSTDSLRIGRLEVEHNALLHEFRQFRDTVLRELDNMKKLFRALSSKMDNIKGPSPSHQNQERLTQGTHQEGTSAEAEGPAEAETEGKDASIRLRFCGKMESPVYHDDELESIKLGIYDGDRIIESGPLSKLKIEVLALEGNFPYNAQDWTSKLFDDHIAYGRDGSVLAGKGTNAQLSNGQCHLDSIRFRESSCRARDRKFIIAARVCGVQAICGRIQEAVMNPVVVLDRRHKYNQKSNLPKLDDEVYRLKNICKNGEYHKKLEKQNICTVENFLKALYKDENSLRSSLNIKPKSKGWDKMVAHAQTCCLNDKPELKSYWCKEQNVILFFNYAHRLVGARFGDHYVASDKFDLAQKILVDSLKRNAYDQLDGLTGDHEMKDNIPVPICMDTEGGAGPSYMTSSAPQQINFGRHTAGHQVGGIPASEVLRPCPEPSRENAHGPNSVPDPKSIHNYQGFSALAVDGLGQGLNESSFAIANSGASPGFPDPYDPTTQNYQDQGIGVAAPQQRFTVVDDAEAFIQHLVADNNWGTPGFQEGEMQYHAESPLVGTTEASAFFAHIYSSMCMIPTPELLNNTGAPGSGQGSMEHQTQASLPNDGTTVSSGSAPQEWSQRQGNMPSDH